MEFWTTEDDQRVRLDRLHLSYTYSGMLEGRPNARYNDAIIESKKKHLLSALFEDTLLIIPPDVDHSDEKHPVLPELCIGVSYLCYEPVDPNLMASSLAVMWFTTIDNGFEPLESARRTISNICWKEHAQSFDW